MTRMGCREIYFINATHSRQIDYLIDRVKEVVAELGLPADYDVRIYKNVYTCCGIGGLGVILEVIGPEDEKIRAIDLRAMSRILEFCEKEGFDVGHHIIEKYELL